MAKFRLVHTSFWNDPRVVEEMTAEDKYFFLYLLTNENTTQIGIYPITKKQMAFDLGYSTESAGALLQRFKDHHKIIKYNEQTREIAIKNWGKFNLVRGGKPILDCVKSELKNVKDTTLISWVGDEIPNESIKQIYDTYNATAYDTQHDTSTTRDENNKPSNTNGSHVTYHDTPTISGQYKDKQQEEEQEQEQEEDKEKDKQQEKEVGPSVIYSFYESNIGPLKPFIGEEIGCEIDEHGPELVLEALKESVTANARNKVKYAQGILRNWKNEGVKSLHDLEMKRNRGENNGNVYARSNGQSANQNGNDPFAGYSSN